MERTEQNEKLREQIVDLADFWDGPVSMRYGKVLMDILEKLGIDDVPVFYTRDIPEILKDLDLEKKE